MDGRTIAIDCNEGERKGQRDKDSPVIRAKSTASQSEASRYSSDDGDGGQCNHSNVYREKLLDKRFLRCGRILRSHFCRPIVKSNLQR